MLLYLSCTDIKSEIENETANIDKLSIITDIKSDKNKLSC